MNNLIFKKLALGFAVCAGLLVCKVNGSGLDSPAEPDLPDSAMWTLGDIYNVLNTHSEVTRRSSPFVEPGADPETGSMRNLNDIMALVTNRALVQKTGQQTSYLAGDDGTHQVGVPWPDPRFTDHGDGTVTDNLTGLMWAKDGNLPGATLSWNDSIDFCNNMNGGEGTYGYNDWRLPNFLELLSLIDYSKFGYAMADGYPFTNLQTSYYWTSTSTADGGSAWNMRLYYGITVSSIKTTLLYLLPVRGRGERL